MMEILGHSQISVTLDTYSRVTSAHLGKRWRGWRACCSRVILSLSDDVKAAR